MALYEFTCEECKIDVERIRFDMSNCIERPVRCPECGEEMTKILSAPMLQFRGTGWESNSYKTPAKRSQLPDVTKNSGEE